MADVTVYHNPNCGSSKNALALLDELGVDYEVVLYLKTPPDRATLTKIVAGLDGPDEDLVRKDNRFEQLGLTPPTTSAGRRGDRPPQPGEGADAAAAPGEGRTGDHRSPQDRIPAFLT